LSITGRCAARSNSLRGENEDRGNDPIQGVSERNSRFTESLRPNRKLNLTTNTMMLLTHLAFILLYLKMKTPILFAYNLVSVAIFLVNFFFAWTRRDAIFYGVIYGEVLVFTTLNILLLGWGYGFELYSFSYAISIQPAAVWFSLPNGHPQCHHIRWD
jgi:hypothetical protein